MQHGGGAAFLGESGHHSSRTRGFLPRSVKVVVTLRVPQRLRHTECAYYFEFFPLFVCGEIMGGSAEKILDPLGKTRRF